MAFDPSHFLDGARYVGRVKSERRVFYVYDLPTEFLLFAPRDSDRSMDVARIPRAYVDEVRRRFAKKTVTGREVSAGVRGSQVQGLRALQVLRAQGIAQARKKRGRSLAYYVRAR